jgi:hypothetical protein
MKRIAEIIKPENCFYTIDGVTLKTVPDLESYLDDCEPEEYSHHVTPNRNDFADWIRDVLILPDLSAKVRATKDITEAIQILLDFLEVYESDTHLIDPEHYFITVDGCAIRDIYEMFYYVSNCEQYAYDHHVNSERNDFLNWIRDALNLKELSSKLSSPMDRKAMKKTLSEFLVGSPLKFEVKHGVMSSVSGMKSNVISSVSGMKSDIGSSAPDVKYDIKADAAKIDAVKVDAVKDGLGLVEDTIAFDRKLSSLEEKPEQDNKIGEVIDKNGFRQFSDEELEKFTSFVRREKNFTTDEKVEYLKTCLEELRNMIRDLRRVGKDPFIADLMIRALSAKIDYYAISKNVADYNNIIHSMKDIQKEIEECDLHTQMNLAEEILKDIRLQSIVMKKA